MCVIYKQFASFIFCYIITRACVPLYIVDCFDIKMIITKNMMQLIILMRIYIERKRVNMFLSNRKNQCERN